MSQREIRADRVAIYIRWSTDDQSDGTTLAVQTDACTHYVKSQGWLVREDLVYVDDGYSGGSLDRPAMTKLRKAVKDGQIDCVVVFKLDRLSRSVIDTVTLVLKEWEDLTHLKSAREPVDTTTAMGKQFFYMLVSYAEWERNVIRERMFSGKMRRAKDGRSPGFPAAFGYEKGPTPGTLLVVDEQALVVRLVYELALQGQTVRFITRYLNEKGYPSRRGAPWGTSMVSKMLHNPIYTGKLVWGRTRLNPRWKKNPGETRVKKAVPYVDSETPNIPAIIGQEEFDRVQRVMEGNKRIEPSAAGSDHLLTGLVKCGRCGRAMQYNAYEKWAYYRCGFKMSQALCDAPSVRAEALEAEVVSALRARFEEVTRQLTDETSSADNPLAQLQADIESIEGQIGRLEAQERRINQDYRSGHLTAEERRTLLGEVQEDRGQLLSVVADLKGQCASLEDNSALIKEQFSLLEDRDMFMTLPASRQKQILRFFVQEIRAGKRGTGDLDVMIKWKGAV